MGAAQSSGDTGEGWGVGGHMGLSCRERSAKSETGRRGEDMKRGGQKQITPGVELDVKRRENIPECEVAFLRAVLSSVLSIFL